MRPHRLVCDAPRSSNLPPDQRVSTFPLRAVMAFHGGAVDGPGSDRVHLALLLACIGNEKAVAFMNLIRTTGIQRDSRGIMEHALRGTQTIPQWRAEWMTRVAGTVFREAVGWFFRPAGSGRVPGAPGTARLPVGPD